MRLKPEEALGLKDREHVEDRSVPAEWVEGGGEGERGGRLGRSNSRRQLGPPVNHSRDMHRSSFFPRAKDLKAVERIALERRADADNARRRLRIQFFDTRR